MKINLFFLKSSSGSGKFGHVQSAETRKRLSIFEFTEIAPEGDIFSHLEEQECNLVANFAARLQQADTTQHLERAKRLYLETLAPGTVRNTEMRVFLFIVHIEYK